jgi:hypothetical protein
MYCGEFELAFNLLYIKTFDISISNWFVFDELRSISIMRAQAVIWTKCYSWAFIKT